MSHWLIIYDICDDKRLHDIAKVMVSYGIRVQKSVFELDAHRGIVEKLRLKIKKIMKDDDFVVYFEVCEKDWQKRMKYGVGRFNESEDKEYYIY